MNKRIDGRSLRKIPNARQFNTKITEELYQKIYQLAQAEGVMIKAVVEQAIVFYLESKKNTTLSDQTNKKATKKSLTLTNETKKGGHKKKPKLE